MRRLLPTLALAFFACQDAPEPLSPEAPSFDVTSASLDVIEPIDLGSTGRSEGMAVNRYAQVAGFNNDRAALWSGGSMTDLGILPGGAYSYAYDINDAGQVMGYANVGWDAAAFFWENGTMIDIGDLGGYAQRWTEPRAMNGSGWIVGESLTPANRYEPFVWTPEGGMLSLARDGDQNGTGFDVNDAGQVVGFVYIGWAEHAFLWEDGERKALDGVSARAVAVNNRGDAVGMARFGTETHPVWWPYGQDTPVDLGTLGGTYGEATDVNDAGQVVGWAYTASWERWLFIWQDGTITRIGPAPFGPRTVLIDNAGRAVGTTSDPTTYERYNFVWIDGEVTKLGGLGGEFAYLRGVSDDGGYAVGSSYSVADGTYHAVLWKLPEVLTPEEIIALIEEAVAALTQDGTLNAGQATSLLASLKGVLDQYENDNANAAANKVGAFLNEVSAMHRSGRLDATQAAELTSLAERLLAAMGVG